MPVILVTGGAGYVGSHACRALARAGHVPVSFDNLSTGHRAAVRFGPLVEGDILDGAALDRAFAEYRPQAVMHFAALSDVGASMADPGGYWQTNVTGTLNLARAALAHGVKGLVFSSSCAVHGTSNGSLLAEESPACPVNPYGRTKLAGEQMLADLAAAEGLAPVIFRYFNAAGAEPEAGIGEDHRPETHLIPLALAAAAGQGGPLRVFGTDYPTPDGTCIRDYVHVADLATAHVLGAEHLLAGGGPMTLNLGSGTGHSVRAVIETVAQVTGHPVPATDAPRRPGDPPRLVSGSALARERLGWQPSRPALATMIGDAWAWMQTGGYG